MPVISAGLNKETPHAPSPGQFTRAVVYILVAIFLYDLQSVIVKFLGERYPVQQLASFRNLFGLIPSLMVLYFSGDWHSRGRTLRIRHWRLGLVRGLCLAAAQFCFYLSLTKMALATATTLAYITPVLITLLSIPLLKHQVGRWRLLAVVVGFIGVLLIMAPGSEVFTLYSLLPVGAALGYALSIVFVRLMDDRDPTALINLYASVGALAGSLIILFGTTGYQEVTSALDWALLLAMGLVGGCAVLGMISAYRLTRPSNLSPPGSSCSNGVSPKKNHPRIKANGIPKYS